MKVFINKCLCMAALIISVHFCQAKSTDHGQLRKKALIILEEAAVDTNTLVDAVASLPSENVMTLALALEALKVIESEKIDNDASNLQPIRFQLTQEIINFMQAEGLSLADISSVIRLPEIGPNATSSGGSNNVAEGNGAQANPTSGDSAVALGNNAIAAVQDTVAIGNTATVTFQSGIALGLNSVVTGTDAVALGNAASAGQARAVALGAGASTTQADAIILGNASNANVAVGIGSSAPAGKLTVFGDANKTALLLTSFSNQSALLLTTTAGLSVAKFSTDPTQPALAIADASGNFATASAGTRMIINGPVTSTATSTITTLSVVGTAQLGGLSVIGTSTFNGNVTITPSSAGSSLIINGATGAATVRIAGVSGQNALATTVGTVSIGAPTTGTALTVSGAAVAATPAVTVNQNASSTTGSALNIVGINGPTGAPITVSAGTSQNSITTSAGTVALPAYSFTADATTGMYLPAANQLALATNATQRLNIDATGSVTAFSQYKVHAYRSGAGQGVGGGANATIVFNSEASPGFDPNANFNIATGTYTAPVTGYYFVSFSVFSSIGGLGLATRTIAVQKNGATLTGYSAQQGTNSTNGTPMSLSAATIVQLNQNDTLRLNYANGSGSSDTIQANSFIDIHFMSF